MSRHTQATRDTKAGTSKSSASETQADVTVTLADLADAPIVATAKPEVAITHTEPQPLSAYVKDYKPAATMSELDHHVHEVFAHGAESTEASDAVFQRLLGPNKSDMSIFYKDVRVFRIGMREKALAAEAGDVESRMFGTAK